MTIIERMLRLLEDADLWTPDRDTEHQNRANASPREPPKKKKCPPGTVFNKKLDRCVDLRGAKWKS